MCGVKGNDPPPPSLKERLPDVPERPTKETAERGGVGGGMGVGVGVGVRPM